jgi:hypothetical protein
MPMMRYCRMPCAGGCRGGRTNLGDGSTCCPSEIEEHSTDMETTLKNNGRQLC